MALCNNCGQQLPENANACPFCGTFVNGQNAQQAAQPVEPQNYQQNAQQAARPVEPQNYQQNAQQAAQPVEPQNYQQNYQQNNYGQNYQQNNYAQNYQQGYGAPQQGYAQPYVAPDMDVQQSRGIAWLSYMGLLFLIPMFVRRQSDYTRFHVKQGVTLCAVELAYGVTYGILMAIINAIFPGHYSSYLYYLPSYYVHSDVYNVFSVLLGLGNIFFFVLAIIGIVNAATGKRKELPLIGKIPWIATLLDKTVYKQ
ncbi:zinc-ribbon domain-containing protein [Ruminococcus sp.]|uniref:zinc-ribbon domain-containing protein n=1 Tax=Ruminococcus sp. TaxID=41978 RepID=UPI00386A437B